MKKVFLLSLLTLSMSIAASAQTAAQEADQTLDVNQYGQTVASVPVEAQMQDGILVFQNKKANYKMWFDVRIQADWAYAVPTPGAANGEKTGEIEHK